MNPISTWEISQLAQHMLLNGTSLTGCVNNDMHTDRAMSMVQLTSKCV